MQGQLFDLERFVRAQAPVIDDVMNELRAGRKTGHWMWFVFPQLQGLGRSEMAQRYGLRSHAEALAYWQHPLLGPRLQACVELLLATPGLTAHQILGSPDDLKLRSCCTLFEQAAPEAEVFAQALARFYGGERDAQTLQRLQAAG